MSCEAANGVLIEVRCMIADFTCQPSIIACCMLPFTNAGEEMQEKSQTLLQPDASLRAVELSKSGVIGLVNESYVKPEFYDKECQTEHQIGDDVSSDENDNAGREELQGGGVDDNQRR